MHAADGISRGMRWDGQPGAWHATHESQARAHLEVLHGERGAREQAREDHVDWDFELPADVAVGELDRLYFGRCSERCDALRGCAAWETVSRGIHVMRSSDLASAR